MTRIQAVWKGEEEELLELINVVDHNCTCQQGSPCPTHIMMAEQKLLDGLLASRRRREKLMLEEFKFLA